MEPNCNTTDSCKITPPVTQSAMIVDQKTVQLSELLHELSQRLEPVLSKGPTGEDLQKGRPVSSTPLAARLDEISDRVDQEIARVRYLLEQLGI